MFLDVMFDFTEIKIGKWHFVVCFLIFFDCLIIQKIFQRSCVANFVKSACDWAGLMVIIVEHTFDVNREFL